MKKGRGSLKWRLSAAAPRRVCMILRMRLAHVDLMSGRGQYAVLMLYCFVPYLYIQCTCDYRGGFTAVLSTFVYFREVLGLGESTVVARYVVDLRISFISSPVLKKVS